MGTGGRRRGARKVFVRGARLSQSRAAGFRLPVWLWTVAPGRVSLVVPSSAGGRVAPRLSRSRATARPSLPRSVGSAEQRKIGSGRASISSSYFHWKCRYEQRLIIEKRGGTG